MNLKTEKEIKTMKEGGEILSAILRKLSEAAKPGIATYELEELARSLVSSYKVKSSFLGFDGYPCALCVSINEEIVHGVPSDRIIMDGDLVKIDMGVLHNGFHTDSATTVLMPGGKDRDIKERLMNVTKEALRIGISKATVGSTLGDLGHAIQKYVEDSGFNVVRDLIGHGIGRELHEDPQVPNYGKPGMGPKLVAGMVIAIEPMVVTGSWKIADGDDGFAYKTKDLSLSAHFEHTVAITEEGPLTITS
ncbi:MAG: Methionine aminopeptidase [Candidatus Yanofskybacteria bacterium GW2011_GWF1_44_227]|uniref:Methionine aminopeptidase n=1 Tax=Candidatus Yanofskybacteria bacterium GW2011_GWE2_40_11 TaxID=1619033 RepID=A0A0G0QRS2_9BACT|nr:MAG: Methionine aminopeptidase [Candidatus Yanofskybacteria bacterium GW2011_GWE1_40_10]KKR40066.1 MAG: Methionine aminopeptidase [Candidatus Yanofskybacteria bacterium GW2011_GWE2_40_11]KKT15053.1 MAG: Methionine aminopeptidase [Candidatus Yanofskybacteria bacterium GW2011_GWF2_43_596]KKT52870.1 MAG: Methionine aminopeptidase [Candidatus Yanofskybacteria bacterium GW2011_GWF1_44_227]OGN35661.1 MAG: type I methionyl aminopeptidase [Candidatus Yanofskybacteria bacterium RIFOXYA1_FULL_44_17]O